MATSDKPSPTERLMEAVGGAQSLALSMTRQATSFAADRIPGVPGFPADLLDAPTEIVDKVFETIEDALSERSPMVRDVIHQQATFVRGVFESLRPIIAALADEDGSVPADTAADADAEE